MKQIPWRRITLTGRLFEYGGDRTITILFLIQCLICMAFDIAIWIALTFLSYEFVVWTFFPFERGFYCNDQNIREPLVRNTVKTSVLLAITLGAPFFIVFIADLFRVLRFRRRHIAQVINRSTFIYLTYCFCFWVMTLAIDAVKCVTGRIRPNFLSMCKPREFEEVCAAIPDAFVPLAHCTAGWKNSRNSKMSFPSGHSTVSVFCTLFLIFYLRGICIRFPSLFSKCMFLLVSLIYIAFTLFCCISRVTDSWHFPSDVLGGILLGSSLYFVLLHKNVQQTIITQQP